MGKRKLLLEIGLVFLVCLGSYNVFSQEVLPKRGGTLLIDAKNSDQEIIAKDENEVTLILSVRGVYDAETNEKMKDVDWTGSYVEYDRKKVDINIEKGVNGYGTTLDIPKKDLTILIHLVATEKCFVSIVGCSEKQGWLDMTLETLGIAGGEVGTVLNNNVISEICDCIKSSYATLYCAKLFLVIGSITILLFLIIGFSYFGRRAKKMTSQKEIKGKEDLFKEQLKKKLKQRYILGEISRKEYLEMKKELEEDY
jgi:uncharacterized membrane protein